LRWALLLLLFANLALAGYLVFIDQRAKPTPDLRALEIDPGKIKLLKSAEVTEEGRACLEWRNLSATEIMRAQEELAKLNVGKNGARGRTILFVEPSPALVARIAELKAAFEGTELKAVVCPADAK